MWHMSGGGGVLEGAQAKLLKTGVAAYVEYLRDSECWDSSEFADEIREHWLTVAQVRQMEHGRRLHMIATTVHALLERSVMTPELTADNEATVYQVYQFINAATVIEYDETDNMLGEDEDEEHAHYLKSIRRAVAAAFRELELCSEQDDGQCGACEWCTPDADLDMNLDRWRGLVDLLADRVLWDRDWEMESFLGNADPTRAGAIKKHAGIGAGYFATPAEEPTPRQVAQAKSYLESIAGEINLRGES